MLLKECLSFLAAESSPTAALRARLEFWRMYRKQRTRFFNALSPEEHAAADRVIANENVLMDRFIADLESVLSAADLRASGYPLPLSRHRPSVPLAEMVKGLETFLVAVGSVHDEDCPRDDTCECSWKAANDGANAAYRYLEAALSEQGQEPKPEPVDLMDALRKALPK